MAAYKAALLVAVLQIITKDAICENDCTDFPFEDDPAWLQLEAVFEQEQVDSTDRSLNAKLFLKDPRSNRYLEDYLKNELKEFRKCFNKVAPSAMVTTLYDTRGGTPIQARLWKFEVFGRKGFPLNNLKRCLNYQIGINAFGAADKSDNSARYDYGTFYRSQAILPPNTNAPDVQVRPGIVDAELDVSSPDVNCKKFVKRILVNCANEKGSMKASVEIDISSNPNNVVPHLFPETKYICKVRLDYSLDGKILSSIPQSFEIQTSKPKIELTPSQTTIRCSIDQQLASYSYVNITMTLEGNGIETRKLPVKEALSRGFASLVPYTQYTVCMLMTFTIDCNFKACETPSRDCRKTITNGAIPPRIENVKTAEFGSSWLVQWDEPAHIYGKFSQYEISVTKVCKDTLYEASCLCKSNTLILHSSENVARLDDLEGNHKYSFQVRLVNHVGIGEWSEHVTNMTRPAVSLHDNDPQVVPGNRSFTVTLKPPCPYTGPFKILYYERSRESEILGEQLYDLRKNEKISPTILDGFNPDTVYEICVRLESVQSDRGLKCKGSSCQIRKCIQKKTLEDIPEDPPKVTEVRKDSSQFTIKIEIPEKPNGIILGYNLEIQVCKIRNPNCPIMVNCDIHEHLDYRNGIKPNRRNGHDSVVYTFDSLEPYNQYRVKAVGYNSVGNSPSAEIVVITRPTLKNHETGINVEPGSDYAVVKAIQDVCPYQGPVEYQAAIYYVNWRSSWAELERKTVIYDLGLGNTSSTIQFEKLESDADYRACLKAVLVARDSTCQSYCAVSEECRDFITKCESVPNPTEIPKSVPWKEGSDDDFNPFTQVKIKVDRFTFNGTVSGLRRYRIHCPKDKTEKTVVQGEDIDYKEDSYVVVTNLKPGSEYKLAVTAYGCKNTSATTAYFLAKTKPFQLGTFKIVKETTDYEKVLAEERLKRNLSSSDMLVLVALEELPINIKYADIAHYKIGDTQIDASQVFDKSNLHPKQDHCLNARLGLDTTKEAVCYMVVAYNPDVERLAFSSAPYNETIYVQTPKSSSGIVLGAISAVVFFLLLLAAAAWLFLWRQRRTQKQVDMDLSTQKVTQAESGPLLDSKNRPLSLRALVTKVEEDRFNVTAEYKKLNELDQRFVAGNQSKMEAIKWSDKANRASNLNRYGNILPYDRKRVVLTNKVGENCDYVNASWIRGFAGSKFIASQGPLEHTCPHFWQMVADNNVNLVVMLTKLKERAQQQNPGGTERMVVKCYPYWPQSVNGQVGQTLDLPPTRMTVKLISEEPHFRMDKLIVRKLQLTIPGSSPSTLMVTQLHYTGWPDHDVMETSREMLTLYKIVREYLDKTVGNLKGLIHCSAGVGRTGTLIALDTLAREIESGKEEVDVFNTVYRMREDRTLMVQKCAQYKYLYQCVAAYIREVVWKEEIKADAIKQSADEYYYCE